MSTSTMRNYDKEGSWRPPLLKNGEYDRWVPEMKSFIISSMNAECWKIIKNGDYQHMDATKQVHLEIEDLNEAQLKELEKNHKALRLLTGGLGDSDKKKFFQVSLQKKSRTPWRRSMMDQRTSSKTGFLLSHKTTTTYVCMRMKPLKSFRGGSCPS